MDALIKCGIQRSPKNILNQEYFGRLNEWRRTETGVRIMLNMINWMVNNSLFQAYIQTNKVNSLE
ncbi:unnamed protein product [Heterobilharzia americana]|nr:unnamed protein product [Heterobilharzia americana]CAH8566719.1 unnamed protein product [Heterobilharzia americana]